MDMGSVADVSGVHDASVLQRSHKALLKQEPIYFLALTHPTHFDPEEEGNLYLRNIGNTSLPHRAEIQESAHRTRASQLLERIFEF
jgi:hypothetical protein